MSVTPKSNTKFILKQDFNLVQRLQLEAEFGHLMHAVDGITPGF